MSTSYPNLDFAELYVGKIDSLQGGERAFLIVDMVVDDALGFLSVDNRPATAVSRAMIGLVGVLDPKMEKSPIFKNTKLNSWWVHMQRKKAVKHVSVTTELVDNITPSSLRELDS